MEWVITKVFVVLEPSEPKPGTIGLQVLKMASMVLDSFSNLERDQHDEIQKQEPSTSLSKDWIIYKYFDAWNQRRMHEAIQCFTPDVTYYDLQYSHPMIGTLQMEQHLHKVAESLPRGFQFVIDDVIVDEHDLKVGLQWHVENHGQTLPFTRGCSFYHLLSSSDYKIQRGLDIPEPAVIKPGFLQRIGSQLVSEPQRILPLIVWFAYMYVVFLSNGILPGANALSLEVRTWEEVRDLSLNFFLVAPLLHLPFSPTVHPMLEGTCADVPYYVPFNLHISHPGKCFSQVYSTYS
jgi:ketosteroid isomerase-like protein